MDIKEIRTRRESLEWELGALIGQFEKETGCEVSKDCNYRSPRDFIGDPKLSLTVEIGLDYEPEDADSEEIPEAKAATA